MRVELVRWLTKSRSAVVFGLGLGCGVVLALFWPARSQSGSTSGVDSFGFEASFSEVENARATLESEASRVRLSLRQNYLPRLTGGVITDPQARAAIYEEWLDALADRAAEFEGTAQEIALREEILLVAGPAHAHERWLNSFFALATDYPARANLARFAGQAVEFALLLNREAELSEIFKHLSGLPLSVEAKESVASALESLAGRSSVRVASAQKSAGSASQNSAL